MFFVTEWVEDGRVIQEVVYAYSHDIELGRGAFDMHFPAATGPAASADRQLYAEGGSKPAAGAKLAAVPRLGGRKPVVDWKIAEEEIFRLMNHHGEFSPGRPVERAGAPGRGHCRFLPGAHSKSSPAKPRSENTFAQLWNAGGDQGRKPSFRPFPPVSV